MARRRTRRRSRSRRRTRSRRGSGLVTCMAKCRDDAAKAQTQGNKGVNVLKNIGTQSQNIQSRLQAYKAAAEQQKKIGSKGIEDAQKAIEEARRQGSLGVSALKSTAKAAGRRKSRRRRSRRRSRKRSRRRSSSRRRKRRRRRSRRR